MATVQRWVVAFPATARLATMVRNGIGVSRHRSYVILSHVAATVPGNARRSLQLFDQRRSDCLRLSFCSAEVPATGDRRSAHLRVLAEARSPAVAVDKLGYGIHAIHLNTVSFSNSEKSSTFSWSSSISGYKKKHSVTQLPEAHGALVLMDDPAFSRRWANIALVSHPLLAWGSIPGFDRADISAVYMPFLVPEQKLQVERDYTGTKHIPIFVMLPLGTINKRNEVDDRKGLERDLKALKNIGVDGVMVDCWWGLVEGKGPQKYNWSGYQDLFSLVRQLKLKLQVVMSFHQCGGNIGDDVYITLPKWVLEVGKEDPHIFFRNRKEIGNPECLTWGVDMERVLRGRTAAEVYFDFMTSFRQELQEFFDDGTITEIEIGLGPCGELRYPSYPETQGWVFPGIGEFQGYDKYLKQNLVKAANARGHPDWAEPPSNAGEYNSKPQNTGFFKDGGDYNSNYGRFFLQWYSQTLIDHGDRVLSLANKAFRGTKIAAKISGIHWWYKTMSHATELTCGYYNTNHQNGYRPITEMLAKHKATLNFTCVELLTSEQSKYFPEAMADPEALVDQVLKTAWDVGIYVASENALECYDRPGYNKILENSKPENDLGGHNLVAFTYLRLNPQLMQEDNFLEFTRFVRRLHGESIEDLPVVKPKPKRVIKPTKKLEEPAKVSSKI